MNGFYRFNKGFHSLSNIPAIFQKHGQKVELPNTGLARRHFKSKKVGKAPKETFTILEELQGAGCRARKEKFEICLKKTTWLDTKHPNTEKTEQKKVKTTEQLNH